MDKVYDYLPAPGQHVNGSPNVKVGETKEDLIRKLNGERPGNWVRELWRIHRFSALTILW